MVGLPEAAARLGLHRATVNDMVHSGRIVATRIGSHWYIAERDLRLFAASYVRPRNAPRRPQRLPVIAPEITDRLRDWGDATVAQLAVVVDMHEGNIRKHPCLAEAQGLVYRDEYGRWSLTDSFRATG